MMCDELSFKGPKGSPREMFPREEQISVRSKRSSEGMFGKETGDIGTFIYVMS